MNGTVIPLSFTLTERKSKIKYYLFFHPVRRLFGPSGRAVQGVGPRPLVC
jgi:hypothetical protein